MNCPIMNLKKTPTLCEECPFIKRPEGCKYPVDIMKELDDLWALREDLL
jgi:hypothetical protein